MATNQPPTLFSCDPRHGMHSGGTLRWMLRAIRDLDALPDIVDRRGMWCIDVESGVMHKRPGDFCPGWTIDECGVRLTMHRRSLTFSHRMPHPRYTRASARALVIAGSYGNDRPGQLQRALQTAIAA